MKKIRDFVDELNAQGGSIYKKSVLQKYKDDYDVLTFLQYYFDPFKITNISTKKITKAPGTYIETRTIRDWDDYLIFLVNECSGKNSDIKAIQNFLQYNKEYADFLRGVATKSIKMGISKSTLNKIYGSDFVPEVKLQLATKYFDNIDKVEGKRFSLSLKLDGIRCLAIRRGAKISLITRAGKPILDCDKLEEELLDIEINGEDHWVMDGELVVESYKSMNSKDVYKRTTEIVKTQGLKRGIVFVAFDFVTIDEWEVKIGEVPHNERFNQLKRALRNKTYVELVPRYYEGEDISKVEEILNKAKANNQEGLMVNLSDDVYQFCRTTSLLKVKVMQDCDLQVIDVQEGRGKYEGTLGALVVEYKGGMVNVGSGLSDVLREKIWNRQDKIIGRVIKVQYFEETQDSSGKKSLRFPVFLEICPRTKEPSTN